MSEEITDLDMMTVWIDGHPEYKPVRDEILDIGDGEYDEYEERVMSVASAAARAAFIRGLRVGASTPFKVRRDLEVLAPKMRWPWMKGGK